MYPVLDILSTLKTKLAETNVVILQAPPGAGKSTVLPLELMNEPWLEGKKILMLEPRRLAAKSVAQRMASILQEDIGERIGYRVRFESRVGKQTKVEVVTEGILTRMLQSDNSLEDAGLVIFDEFHERSLHADLALALCLQAQQLLDHQLKLPYTYPETQHVSRGLYGAQYQYLGWHPTATPCPVSVSFFDAL